MKLFYTALVAATLFNSLNLSAQNESCNFGKLICNSKGQSFGVSELWNQKIHGCKYDAGFGYESASRCIPCAILKQGQSASSLNPTLIQQGMNNLCNSAVLPFCSKGDCKATYPSS